jgi:hypothetical protein
LEKLFKILIQKIFACQTFLGILNKSADHDNCLQEKWYQKLWFFLLLLRAG